MQVRLNDKLEIQGRKLVSARDGYQEYLGMEIGIEPYNKTFKVYRSPEVIQELSTKLIGIPLINEHESDTTWEDGKEIDKSIVLSNILTSEVKEATQQIQDSTIEIHNVIEDTKAVQELLQEKKELSVGYICDMEESADQRYDYEQKNIMPRHLAIVENGRCLDVCSFKDSLKGLKLDKEKLLAFINAQEDEELKKMLLSLLEGKDEENKEEEGNPITDEDLLKELSLLDEEMMEKVKDFLEELKNPEKQTDEEPKPEKIADSLTKMKDKKALFSMLMKDKAIALMVEDSVRARSIERTLVIDKARKIIPEYDFDKASTCEIRKAAVKAALPNEKFEDSEIPAIFKIIDRAAEFKLGITDGKSDPVDDLRGKEIGAKNGI